MPSSQVGNDVVVTGMGAITHLGWELADLAPERLTCSAVEVARCSAFDPSAWLTAKEVRRSDRFVQMALCAAQLALEQAGWNPARPYPAERVGVIVGSCFGGCETTVRELGAMHSGSGPVSPFALPTMLPSAAAAAISIKHRIEGECLSSSASCASGGHAIALAARLVRSGQLDAVLTGGAEAPITPYGMAAFRLIGAMSPTGVARPFDRDRDGFVMGEGAGVLVLESASRARARGAPIQGRIAGSAATGDAFHSTAPAPGGSGATRAIANALTDAGIEPKDVCYINAHGTGTVANDCAEAAAIRAVFGDLAGQPPVSSIKSATGHSMGASGAIEAIATLQALQLGQAPPTAGLRRLDNACELRAVAGAPLQLEAGGAVAVSNSFGFGGHNVALMLEAERP